MLDLSVNWLAVLVAAVINMVVGATWYSPVLFGKKWAHLIGKKMEDMQASAGPGYAITTVAALLQAFLLAVFTVSLHVTTLTGGALLGLLIWLGFVATTTVSDYVFAGRPAKLWALNTGYYLVVLVVDAALLAAWH